MSSTKPKQERKTRTQQSEASSQEKYINLIIEVKKRINELTEFIADILNSGAILALLFLKFILQQFSLGARRDGGSID